MLLRPTRQKTENIKELKMTEKMISALKRKDIKSIIVTLLAEAGHEEASKEVQNAGRITSALIDRTCGALEEKQFGEPLPAFAEQAIKDAEKENELIAIDADIKALLAKGKGKKAMKLIKAAMEMGVKGSVIKELLAEAKQLKKEREAK